MSEQAANEPGSEELLGRTIGGKYVVTRLLGRGGMGEVYEAEHAEVGKRVALKFIDREWAKDEVIASRFAREARAANAIESEHIVQVFDAGTEAGRPYIVMELLRGEDLGGRLRRAGTIPVGDALHVIAQVLRGLSRAHAAGIIHRDLKPDNVFLTERGADPLFVTIVDFGISKIERPKAGTTPMALTQRGIILGTPFYMAPEQAQAFSDVDGRADLYSVAAILFECLTGRPPHTGETYEQVIVSICMRDALDVRVFAPDVPEAVALYIARGLKRTAAERFESADAMLEALQALAPDDPAARPVVSPRAHTLGAAPPDAFVPTQIAGAPTGVSWTAGSSGRTALEGRRTRGKRAPVVIAVTGLLATVAGIAATIGVMEGGARDVRPATALASTTPAPAAPEIATLHDPEEDLSVAHTPEPPQARTVTSAVTLPVPRRGLPPVASKVVPVQASSAAASGTHAAPKPTGPLDIDRTLPR